MNKFFSGLLLILFAVTSIKGQTPKRVEIPLDKKDRIPTAIVIDTEKVFLVQEINKSTRGKKPCTVKVYNSQLKKKKEIKFSVPRNTSMLDYSFTRDDLFLVFTQGATKNLVKRSKLYSIKIDLKKYKAEECLVEVPVSADISEIQAVGDKLLLGGKSSQSKLDAYFKACCGIYSCGLAIPLGMVNLKPDPVLLSIDYKTERITLKNQSYKTAVVSNINGNDGFYYSVIRKIEDKKISSEVKELDAKNRFRKIVF